MDDESWEITKAKEIYEDLLILFTSGGHSFTEAQIDDYAVGVIAMHLVRAVSSLEAMLVDACESIDEGYSWLDVPADLGLWWSEYQDRREK